MTGFSPGLAGLFPVVGQIGPRLAVSPRLIFPEDRMKPEEIAALLNEPACAHNKKSPNPAAPSRSPERRKAAAASTAHATPCCRSPMSRISSTARSAAPVPPGTIAARAPAEPTLYRIGMTTDLSDMDVIMGRGEKRLYPGDQAGDRDATSRPLSSSTTPACPPCRATTSRPSRKPRRKNWACR